MLFFPYRIGNAIFARRRFNTLLPHNICPAWRAERLMYLQSASSYDETCQLDPNPLSYIVNLIRSRLLILSRNNKPGTCFTEITFFLHRTQVSKQINYLLLPFNLPFISSFLVYKPFKVHACFRKRTGVYPPNNSEAVD